MKVKLKTVMAGPNGTYQPGAVADLPEKDAYALCEGGFAEQVEEPKPAGFVSDELHDTKPVEHATTEAPERTVSPAQGKQHRRKR